SRFRSPWRSCHEPLARSPAVDGAVHGRRCRRRASELVARPTPQEEDHSSLCPRPLRAGRISKGHPMKNTTITLAAAAVAGLLTVTAAPAVAGGHGNKPAKVELCHKPGAPAEKTLKVPPSAVPGHLGHGDYLGACEPTSEPTTEPTTDPEPTTEPTEEPTEEPT